MATAGRWWATRVRWTHLTLGGVLGSLAYLVNYGMMYLFLSMDGATWTEGWSTVGSEHPHLKFTGQVLYNAHFVDMRLVNDASRVRWLNFVADPALQDNLTSTVPSIIYHTAPVVGLVLAGFLLFHVRSHSDTRVRALTAGLGLVPAYLLLAVVGVSLFRIAGPFSWTTPNLLPAILLAGTTYPLLCGTIGGLAGHVVDDLRGGPYRTMRAYLPEWINHSVPRPTVLDLLVALGGALGYTSLFILGWDLRADGWDTIGYVLLYTLSSVPAPVGFVYAVLGLFVTGGSLAFLFKAHRLFSPIVVVGGLVGTVWYLEQPHEYAPPPSPVEQFIVWWPLVVGVSLVAGVVEYRLTRS